MKILNKTHLSTFLVAVGLAVMGVGCAASDMMGAAEMADRSGNAFPQALPCTAVDGGCFHGNMQCTELDIADSNSVRTATCLDNNFQHTISGTLKRAACFELENVNGEPCQVCQTQDGETVYDDCFVSAEERADECEEEVEQLRDGILYLCDICKDEEGTIISESCRPKESECQTNLHRGPYVCEECTDSSGALVFSECVLKPIDPVAGTMYEMESWQCVDLYDANENLLRHNCTGGDVDAEKQQRSFTESTAFQSDDSEGSAPEQEETSPSNGSQDSGSSDGDSGEEDGGVGDGNASEDTDNPPGADSESEEDNCEVYFPDDNTRCVRCFDEDGTITSDVCSEVDRRADRCERLETETESCIFCTNEIGELVEESCEIKNCERGDCESQCITGTQEGNFCRFCGEDPVNPTETVCMSETPLLECTYQEIYEEGQSCAKTCMVCMQGSEEVFRSCEGNAGGYEPAPPVCEERVMATGTCQLCRDPDYNILMASSCSETVVTGETQDMGVGNLECTVAETSSVLAEALCLRNHSCGGAYITDEASNTYGMDPLCGASDVLTRMVSTCEMDDISNTTPTLSEIIEATAGNLAENIIAFYLIPVSNDAYVSGDCFHYGLSAIVASNTVTDYNQMGWE